MNDIIKKSNDMIAKFRYKLSKPQTRLIHYLICRLRVDDADFKTYSLPVADILATTGMSSQGAYNKIRTEAQSLMKKVFTFEEFVEGQQVQKTFAWFSFIGYVKNSGQIQVRFDKGLKPYLLELKRNFITYPLAYTFKMRFNSVRIYEFLKQASVFKSSKTFNLEILKQQLQIDKMPCYEDYNHIKTKILLPAIKEITENTEIKVLKLEDTGKAHKKGNKIVTFTLFFELQVPPKESEVRALALESLASSGDEILENFDPDPIPFQVGTE